MRCVLCVVVVLVVVVVVLVEGGEEEGGWRRRRETNRTIWAKVSLKVAETEQPYQEKRMIGGIGDTLFAILFSNLKMGKIQKFLW